MDPLLSELTSRGVVDSTGADWARAHQRERGGAVDTALLELDLVDEEELLRGLEACTGLPAAELAAISTGDRELAKRLPRGFTGSFQMCPLALAGGRLTAAVESPLSGDALRELSEVFGLEVEQRIAPAHYVAMARCLVYGLAADERTRALEGRLGFRRAADVRRATDEVARAASLGAAAAAVLDFAAAIVEFCGVFVLGDDELRVAASRGGVAAGASVTFPDPASTLSASVRHGGYFLGPVAGTDADRAWFAALERDVPRYAFVAPFAITRQARGLFVADNGQRGLAKRRVAELTLLVARLGQRAGDWETRLRWDSWAAAAETALEQSIFPGAAELAPEPEPAAEPEPEPEPAAAVTDAERRALDRLRRAAEMAGKPIDELVDDLLSAPPPPPPPAAPNPVELAGEVKGLFEKLATDIPAQLARGMESAFRDMMPRLASAAPPPAAAAAPSPSAAASVDLVVKQDAKPREVPSYRSRRAKSQRRKL